METSLAKDQSKFLGSGIELSFFHFDRVDLITYTYGVTFHKVRLERSANGFY